MSEQTRKEQMKKVPQIKRRGKLQSKRFSKSNGYSMKQGRWLMDPKIFEKIRKKFNLHFGLWY